MRRLAVATSILLSALMMSHFALAHTEEQLATMKAPHGGQLRAAGPFHLELVAKDGELTLYITDHGDKAIPTSGGQGKANIQAGKDGEKQSVMLEPVFGNMMKAKGDFKITPETSVAVFVAIPGHDTQGARFMPQAATGTGSGDHDHNDHDHGDDDDGNAEDSDKDSNKHHHHHH